MKGRETEITSKEWYKAAIEGAYVVAKLDSQCDGYPIVAVEVECGILTIDVVGATQLVSIDDCEIEIR